MAQQELLGEFLAGFQLGAFLDRPPAWNPDPGAGVGQPFVLHQVAFFPGYAQVHLIGNHPVDQRRQIPGGNGLGQAVDGVAAREAIHFRSGRRFLQCLDQRVFTPTFSNDGNFHTHMSMQARSEFAKLK